VRRAADEATVLRLETATYTVPTEAPEADGALAWDSVTLVVVHVFPADGTTGLGWTYAGRACRNLGRPDVVSCAIAAVELAMWDLKARLLGLPLCRLLGQVHEQVPVYGSVGFTSYDDAQLRAQLELWTQELRIPRVKIKIGESWGSCEQRDLAGVRQAREVVGPDVVLYVDANGGYSPAHAVRVGQQLAEQDVTWFEEPVSSDDLAGLARIRGGVRLRPPPTSDGCARSARSTACRSTSPAAAGSPSGCGRRRSRQRTGWTSARTALRHCTHVAAPCRTCGTWSTSTTTGSSTCCSTERCRCATAR